MADVRGSFVGAGDKKHQLIRLVLRFTRSSLFQSSWKVNFLEWVIFFFQNRPAGVWLLFEVREKKKGEVACLYISADILRQNISSDLLIHQITHVK
jgi:hypothetical protein